jgi:hypothetical protein
MNITIEQVKPEENKERFGIVAGFWGDSWKELMEKGALAPEIPHINVMNGIFFLLKVDDVPVGIRVYHKITSEFYDSNLTYVKPEYREQRISITTRQMAIDALKELGVKRLTTIVSLLASPEMIENFKSLGIEPTAHRYEWNI